VSNAITPIAQWCAAIVEAVGIGIIILIALSALLSAAIRLIKKEEGDLILQGLRQRLGQGILLGLEFLIAADIIHTVAVDFTFQTVGVLGVIVVIRTFLSFMLEVELTGKWPWENAPHGPQQRHG
jgi:uncharacterized membrane protein